MMNKSTIERIRIDIQSGKDSALALMLRRDGSIRRQGNGTLPPDPASIEVSSDSTAFIQLIEQLDERVFPHAAVYDHPNKIGLPITWSIAFLDDEHNVAVFEFRFGSETTDVGELLPYFDGYISQAVALTDKWYGEGKLNTATPHL